MGSGFTYLSSEPSPRWELVLQREAALEVGMRKLKLMEAQEQKRASSALASGRQGKEATIDVVANLAMVPRSNPV
jgi:hypothetical protein